MRVGLRIRCYMWTVLKRRNLPLVFPYTSKKGDDRQHYLSVEHRTLLGEKEMIYMPKTIRDKTSV